MSSTRGGASTQGSRAHASANSSVHKRDEARSGPAVHLAWRPAAIKRGVGRYKTQGSRRMARLAQCVGCGW